MTDYKVNARSVINAFLWEELKNSGILKEDQYRPDNFTKSIVPIVPSQEIPELNNLIPDLPHIIYDYEVSGYGDEWWICEERMLYTVIANTVSEVSEIIELIIDLFRRVDDSGKEVQLFNPKSNTIKFYTISLDNASGPGIADLEGGRIAGSVEISYKYSRYLDSSGRFV